MIRGFFIISRFIFKQKKYPTADCFLTKSQANFYLRSDLINVVRIFKLNGAE